MLSIPVEVAKNFFFIDRVDRYRLDLAPMHFSFLKLRAIAVVAVAAPGSLHLLFHLRSRASVSSGL